MSNLTTQDAHLVETIEQEIITLKNQIMPGASDGDLKLFAKYCTKTKLDPFSRQIYAISRGGKWTYQTSIDGFRVVAERSGKYEGQTANYWCDKDGVWVDVWLKDSPPVAAKVGVYRKGHREPIWGIAKFSSYAQMYNGRLGGLWAKMPDLMIAKCAESLALRRAFPNDLSGLYTSEEMAQADAPQAAHKSNIIASSTPGEAEAIIEAEAVKWSPSKKQVQRLYALCAVAGMSRDEFKEKLSKIGLSSSRELSEKQYDLFCTRLEELGNSKNEERKQAQAEAIKPKTAKEASFKLDI